jgi:hypothetical protein
MRSLEILRSSGVVRCASFEVENETHGWRIEHAGQVTGLLVCPEGSSSIANSVEGD